MRRMPITITLGYGRTRAGRVGNATGFNAYVLRGSTAPWFGAAEISKTGDELRLVNTQDHWTIEGRNIVRSAALEEFKAKPDFAKEMEHMKLDKPISLYPAHDYSTSPQWGMAIDMNTCTGCGSCVVACVAENNIPVVGKEQVSRNREMHWLRIDRYYTGDIDNPGHLSPADAVPAVRERALRSRLPGGGDHAQRRRPERHGLQPLRRHALLLQQLPVQGAALQFPALPGLEHDDV